MKWSHFILVLALAAFIPSAALAAPGDTNVVIGTPERRVSESNWTWSSKPIERPTRAAQATIQHADVLVIDLNGSNVQIFNNSPVETYMWVFYTEWSGSKGSIKVPIQAYSDLGGNHSEGINEIKFWLAGVEKIFEAKVNPKICGSMQFKATIRHSQSTETYRPDKRVRQARLTWTNRSSLALVSNHAVSYGYYSPEGQLVTGSWTVGGMPVERGEDDSAIGRSVAVTLNTDDSIDERTRCAAATVHDLWHEVPSVSFLPPEPLTFAIPEADMTPIPSPTPRPRSSGTPSTGR